MVGEVDVVFPGQGKIEGIGNQCALSVPIS